MAKARNHFRRAAAGRKSRARSEKRQRTRMFTVRFSEQEAEIVRQLVERTGLSAGALIRRALLDAPPPRSLPRPPVDVEAVNNLLGKLATTGASVNQLAKRANMGRFDNQENIRNELRAFADLRLPCLQALGHERERHSGPPSDEPRLNE